MITSLVEVLCSIIITCRPDRLQLNPVHHDRALFTHNRIPLNVGPNQKVTQSTAIVGQKL